MSRAKNPEEDGGGDVKTGPYLLKLNPLPPKNIDRVQITAEAKECLEGHGFIVPVVVKVFKGGHCMFSRQSKVTVSKNSSKALPAAVPGTEIEIPPCTKAKSAGLAGHISVPDCLCGPGHLFQTTSALVVPPNESIVLPMVSMYGIIRIVHREGRNDAT